MLRRVTPSIYRVNYSIPIIYRQYCDKIRHSDLTQVGNPR